MAIAKEAWVSMLAVAVVTGVALWFINAAVQWWRLRQALNQCAGAKIHPIFGTMLEHRGGGAGTLAYGKRYSAIDPLKPLRFCIGPFINFIALRTPSDIKQVVTMDAPKSPFIFKLMAPWLGPSSILIADGPIWRYMRTLLDPAFHRTLLTDYVTVMGQSSQPLIDKFEKIATTTPDEAVDVMQHYALYTFDTLCRCAFNYETNCQTNDDNKFCTAVTENSEVIIARAMNPLLASDVIFALTPTGRRFRKTINYIHTVAQSIIDQRRENLKGMTIDDIAQHKRPSGRALFDFLDICLLSRDKDGNPAMTDDEIRDQCHTFLFAGHDTTTAALSFVTHCLAKYPEHQEKCREEVFELLGPDEPPTLDDLAKLPYTSACIKEAMRIYPIVPGVQRCIQQPITLESGITLPANAKVMLSIYLLHRNPLIWDNPEEYRPERFLHRRVDQYSFMPFSVGNRNCIGYNFALNEVRTAMCQLLRRFKFVDIGHEPILQNKLVLKSANGVKVKIQKLDN